MGYNSLAIGFIMSILGAVCQSAAHETEVMNRVRARGKWKIVNVH